MVHTEMESVAKHMRFSVPPLYFKAPSGSETSNHVSLAELLMIGLTTFDGEEALKIKEALPLWNPIINRTSVM